MKVAIQNLIDNALRYTLPGGKVTVEIKCAKMELEFSVKDSGVGIPQDQQDRVFTKFFRGANVIRMETEGSGLGLFITKNIIEAHRGRIWFKSKENVGSTFYFTLPLKEEFEEFLRKF
jgi:signal transduction histidine kinase